LCLDYYKYNQIKKHGGFLKMKNKNKLTRTYVLTKEIIIAIEKATQSNKIGDSKNTIVKNCLIHGLKELYNVDIK
jgi:hypothetical protein